MKILKIKIIGLPLFIEPLEVDFYAQQNVVQDKNEMLTNLFSNIYTNNVISVIGINASGKTTTLKAISFVLQMLKNRPINSISCNVILNGLGENNKICIETYFYDEDQSIYKLQTYIRRKPDNKEQLSNFIITKETLWKKSIKSVRSKKELFNYNDVDIFESRDLDDIYLLDDVSIIIGLNKKNKFKLQLIDSIEWTNFNGLRILGDFPLELVKFLDPNIEYLYCKSKDRDEVIELKLKFLNTDEIILNSPLELGKYLSSGTIKGINVFIAAMLTLQDGGYLIIDAVENHFNIEIVSTLIRFFTDISTNKNGATIIFSTHYTELIDSLDRNDCIYVSRNIGGIRTDNLNAILTRNDVKKSEWFQSGYLEFTTPSYQTYIDFKRKLVEYVKDGEV